MKRHFLFGALGLGLACAIAGCGSGSTGTVETAEQRDASAKSANVHPNNAPPSNAMTLHSVPESSSINGNKGFRVTPKDPNDPKFRMDPKLAGGG